MLLTAGQYTEANVKMAEANQDFVMGFISMTPAKWAWGPGAPGSFLCHMSLCHMVALSKLCTFCSLTPWLGCNAVYVYIYSAGTDAVCHVDTLYLENVNK